MKRNRRTDLTTFDRIYNDWPELPRIRSITVKPLKSIYYNRSADLLSVDIVLNTWEELESFCDSYNITLL